MANPVLTRGFQDQRGPIVDAEERMSIGGVGRSTLILFALFMPAAVWGWNQVTFENFPTWTIGAILFGFVGNSAAQHALVSLLDEYANLNEHVRQQSREKIGPMISDLRKATADAYNS